MRSSIHPAVPQGANDPYRAAARRLARAIAALMALHIWTPLYAQVGPGSASQKPGTIVTVAGNGEFALRDGGPAASAELAFPRSVAVDAAGNLYIADVGNHRVRRVDSAGVITTVAGTDVSGFGGDAGPAASAQLYSPHGVAVDAAGNLYIADVGNHCVRRVDSAGVITTVAGTGERGFGGDAGPAASAQLFFPSGVAVDGSGNLYIADRSNHRVRRVDPAGVITTVAGTGERGFGGDAGPAASAQLFFPSGVAVDGSGNLYIADRSNHRVRRVDPAGVITTVAGTGERGFGGDAGPAASAQLFFPSGVAVDGSGNLYIADRSNHRVRRVDPAGVITTVAGTGEGGFAGDTGLATSAQLAFPEGVAVDMAGNLYIADVGNHRVRKVDPAGVITTVAGAGAWRYGGDGGPATSAQLHSPEGMAVDAAGNLYIADVGNHRVRKIDSAGVITTVAGTGERGHGGDGRLAASAQLQSPRGVTVDAAGNLYIADSSNHRVRRVDPAGVITTVAGTGERGHGGDGRPATSAQLSFPSDVAVDAAGNLYIADYSNHRVRRVDPAGVISTVAGTGERSHGGDGGPATSAQLYFPSGVAVDAAGNLYIADYLNDRVRRVNPAGVISTVAGSGERGHGGDGGPATSAQLYFPSGVAVDAAGNLYIADYLNDRVRRVNPAGVISTVAGSGERGYGGDGGPAASAQLYFPAGVAVDRAGNLYIADRLNHRVRRIALSGLDGTGMPVAADDHGNDAASATRLDLNSSRRGRIETSGDEDWFRLETNGPRDVWIRTTGGLNTVGMLLDASNQQVASDDDGGDGSNFAIEATVAAGVYYVRVQGFGSETGGYTIHENGQASVQPSAPESGTITTVAGIGREGYSGDGGPATIAQLNSPVGVAVDPAGNLYVAERYNHRVRKVDRSGVITTVAGTGAQGFSGDGGPAVAARLDEPADVALDAAGNLYISEFNNSRVRRVDTTGVITTVVGTGVQGFSGDGGPATRAYLSHPAGVALDSAGNLYVADAFNHRVRMVDQAGVITTVAGSGSVGQEHGGYGGDGHRATSALLDTPAGVAVDAAGNLYIADWGNERVRRINLAGVITTVAGTGEFGSDGDGGPATSAQLASPSGVAVDEAGNLYIAEQDNNRVRRVDQAGVITTVAGTGNRGYGGDEGAAASARLAHPVGLAVDGSGNLYVADAGNNRVRRVTWPGEGGTTPPVATDDHGNDAAGATRLGLNSSHGGTIETAGDEDWFRLETSGPRVVRIGTTGGADTFGTLFDGSIRELVSDDDGGDGSNFALEATVVAGVYYVAVKGFESATGSYTIHERGESTVPGTGQAGPGPANAQPGTIATIAGIGEAVLHRDGSTATSVQLAAPVWVTVDAAGNLYIVDEANHRVRRVDRAGVITTVAGTGVWGYSGDGGPATAAQLHYPQGVAVDATGNLYIADQLNHRVRRVDRAGVITTVAGTGVWGYSGDGGPATAAQLHYPQGVAVDATGNLYIADQLNHRVRRVDRAGVITTVAGTGVWGYSGDGGPATGAQLDHPQGVAVDAAGNLYIGDSGNERVRRVDRAGVITTVAGTDAGGAVGDGGPATDAQLASPGGVAVDRLGNLYIGDSGSARVRRVDPAGVITTVAGTGVSGYSGDGGPATNAQLTWPAGVAVDRLGNLYIVDRENYRVRRVDRAGVITTVAGTGGGGPVGDGGPATSAALNQPGGMVVDGLGNLFIAENANHRVRRVDPAGVITTVAGTGVAGHSGDGGPAASARLGFPEGVVVDAAGNLYIADSGNHRVRRVDRAGVITTVAGTGVWGYSGDGGPATGAQFRGPEGVAVDGAGNLYIADSGNHRVRRVDRAGVITTVAGMGVWGYSGDGGPATNAQLTWPADVAVDRLGNLYIVDRENYRVRRVDPAGVITTVAGTGVAGHSGDGGPAASSRLNAPEGVVVDAAGNLYIADSGNHRVRRVDRAGVITTVAGTGVWGYSGDGGPATNAQLTWPAGVAVDGASNLYVADTFNHRVRRLELAGAITAQAASRLPGLESDFDLDPDNTGAGGITFGNGRFYVVDLREEKGGRAVPCRRWRSPAASRAPAQSHYPLVCPRLALRTTRPATAPPDPHPDA